jgi:hypothetical protein
MCLSVRRHEIRCLCFSTLSGAKCTNSTKGCCAEDAGFSAWFRSNASMLAPARSSLAPPLSLYPGYRTTKQLQSLHIEIKSTRNQRTVCAFSSVSRPPTRDPSPRRRHSTASRLQELAQYVDIHGHADVPCDHPTGLGRWSAQQRHRWQRGLLSTETFRALSSLGFIFDAHEASWMCRFRQLAQFHSERGNCHVHHADKTVPPGLYAWMLLQRQYYRQGRLADERARRLEGLGFVWQPQVERWERRFSELQAFVARHGHARVPRGWPQNPALAAWVESIRARWRSRDGARRGLTHSQEARLRDIGFQFDAHVAFEVRLDQLKRARRRPGGKARLPNAGMYAGLRDWVTRQRTLWRAGKLSALRKEALLAAGLEPPRPPDSREESAVDKG